MFKPTTGDLLRGIGAGLEQSVLPELTSGGAQRQLKAALHILRRLEHSWDRLPEYLVAENRDIQSTLQEIFSRLDGVHGLDASRLAHMRERLHSSGSGASSTPGQVDDPPAARMAELNLGLQELVIDVDSMFRAESGVEAKIRRICLNALAALYIRMIDREMCAWGTALSEGI